MFLTDEQIGRLLAERKPNIDPVEMLSTLAPDPTSRSKSAMRKVPAGDGGLFVVRVRQSVRDPYDFSIILTYEPERGHEFILRRHNGSSHRHRNSIEGSEFENRCHIHEATERYQRRGTNAEHYAMPTGRFDNVATGLECMLHDSNFAPPAQSSLGV